MPECSPRGRGCSETDQGQLEIGWQPGTRGLGSVRTEQDSTLVLAISVARLWGQQSCRSSQDRSAQPAPSPLAGLLPPALPAAPSCSQQLQLCLLRQFWKHRAPLQPWLLLPSSPLPHRAGFAFECCFSPSWNSPGWSRAGRRRAGTWPRAVAGLGARCRDAQECPSRSFALSFLSLALVKIFQSCSDGSQMCYRCLCFTEHCAP